MSGGRPTFMRLPSRRSPRNRDFQDNWRDAAVTATLPPPRRCHIGKSANAQRIYMSDYLKAPSACLSAVVAATLMLAACNKADQTATPAAAAAKPDAETVATVNGTLISRTAFDVYLTSLMQGKSTTELTSEQKGQI